MTRSSCHCGAVRVEVPQTPTELKSCNCSICRRNGSLWAYFSPKDVRISPPSGATDIYMWGDKMLELHRCKVCGCVTHWAPVDKTYDRMGVNARLMAPEIVAAARIIPFDGASM